MEYNKPYRDAITRGASELEFLHLSENLDKMKIRIISDTKKHCSLAYDILQMEIKIKDFFEIDDEDLVEALNQGFLTWGEIAS
jgi:hypothetical protein